MTVMRKLITILALLFSAALLQAENLRLAHIFSDHMVLQRNAYIPVWGWGEPGAKVKVTTHWNMFKYETKVAADGTWRVNVKTGEARSKGGATMVIKSGKEEIRLNDILLGEVWICAGQSNMQMPVGGFGFQEVEGARDAILAAASYADRIRVFDIRTPLCPDGPVDDVDAEWKRASAGVCAGTSAVAWFFATALASNLDVPVGIIVNPWGGSRIEPWMTRESIAASGISEEEQAFIDNLRETSPYPQMPVGIWNGRMAPIAGYGARGFIWYQGCANIGQECYDKLQTAMVKLWREAWGNDDMPFLFTLLAPYEHGDVNGRARPHFVEVQLRSTKTTPDSYAICTETIGSKSTIHPPKKKEVGDMMALRALQNVYGQELGFDIELPELQSVECLEDGRAKVTLTHVWSNLQSISARDIVGFELAGEDRVFHLAEAEVDWDGQTVFVKCADVPRPVAVRYAFRNWMGANMQTSMGIPVPPFRTDDWDL